MTHEKRVEIRWSDVDAYMHVNNAVYATYLEECRDETTSSAGHARSPRRSASRSSARL
jgi:acyl-CoA thioesterase FadM